MWKTVIDNQPNQVTVKMSLFIPSSKLSNPINNTSLFLSESAIQKFLKIQHLGCSFCIYDKGNS